MPDILATFVEPEVLNNGDIRIPVSIMQHIIHFNKTHIEIKTLSGDTPFGFAYVVAGNVDDFSVTMRPPSNTKGVLIGKVIGDVLLSDDSINPFISNRVVVAWNTLTPEVVKLTTPHEIANGIYQSEIQTDIPVVGFGINSFLYGIPTESRYIFRSLNLIGDTDTLPPVLDENDIAAPACYDDWVLETDTVITTPAKHFLLRFKQEYADETEFPELSLIPGSLKPA